MKVFEGLTVNADVVAPAVPLLIVIGPVAVPATTTKLTEAEETLEKGCPIVPPPCFGMEIWGAEPKLLPVTVTKVPTGPDFGLKSVIVGLESAVQTVVRTALITIWTSTTLITPSTFKSIAVPVTTPRASLIPN